MTIQFPSASLAEACCAIYSICSQTSQSGSLAHCICVQVFYHSLLYTLGIQVKIQKRANVTSNMGEKMANKVPVSSSQGNHLDWGEVSRMQQYYLHCLSSAQPSQPPSTKAGVSWRQGCMTEIPKSLSATDSEFTHITHSTF